MGRNKAEILFRLGIAAVAAATGIACSQPEAQRITQVVVPPLEEPAQKSPEQATVLPETFRRLLENPETSHFLLEWRATLPPEDQVVILDYGLDGQSGYVESTIGMLTRSQPSLRAFPGPPETWLRFGQRVYWPIELRITDLQSQTQEWAVIPPPPPTPDGETLERWPYPLFVRIGEGFIQRNLEEVPTEQHPREFFWTPRG